MKANFKCSDKIAQKCTDRAGDGIFDGPVPLMGRTTDFTTVIDKELVHSTFTQVYSLTTNYADRLLTEQCDNGGEPDFNHGCDELG